MGPLFSLGTAKRTSSRFSAAIPNFALHGTSFVDPAPRAQEIVVPQGMMGSADSNRTHHALV